MFNSDLQADRISSLLHHPGVISIEQKKALRRANVARLLAEHGQTRLAELTGLAPALLYQFGNAKGKSKRNVNDQHARGIEMALGLAAGWMDIDHGAASGEEQAAERATAPAARTARWPFRFAYERFARLSASQRERIEEVVEGMVLRCEASSHPSTRKSGDRRRRLAG